MATGSPLPKKRLIRYLPSLAEPTNVKLLVCKHRWVLWFSRSLRFWRVSRTAVSGLSPDSNHHKEQREVAEKNKI
jgi:hypothetical protein